MANENDIPTTEADQLRTAVQEVIKMATLQGKVAERDDSEKNKLQTELATLQAEKDASEKKLQMELKAEKDASEKKLQTELATLQAENDASENKLQTEMATLQGKDAAINTLLGDKDTANYRLLAEKDASKKELPELLAVYKQLLAHVRADRGL